MTTLPAISFGERQLMKLGWTQGTGLGLLKDGITKPITAVYKNDTIGLGKGRDDYKHEWWDDLYTTTATHLASPTTSVVKVEVKKEGSLYKSFTNTFVAAVVKKERMSDKELFEMCGGRSGNQRARLNAARDSDEEGGGKRVKIDALSRVEESKPKKLKEVKVKKSKSEGREDKETREEKKARRSERNIKRSEKAARKQHRLLRKQQKQSNSDPIIKS